MKRSQVSRIAVTALLVFIVARPALAREEPSVAELKERLANTDLRNRPALCIRISELELNAAGRLYNSGAILPAQAALADVVSFAGLAREYAIQTHKHEKESEIALRRAAHKLADLKHAISRDDQAAVQNAIDRLQRFRDDLLSAMFPHGGAE